ncbi:hypothetical protein [Anaerococcus sp.]|uniref:hypothetical protein n=1 Tax=Anaerococcus sp. TaxID=1872515 RepID=UPI0028FFB974|nr:hypothetical protein [Anaerococcus sp.]MDU3212354.1 hypothetical protein [Anaerococcus sp.]
MGKSKDTYLKKVIKDNKIGRYRKNMSKISDVSINFETDTLYVGSRKRNGKVLLRLYNKKKEQLS